MLGIRKVARFSVAAVLALTAYITPPAVAQTVPAADSAAKEAEVVVTARRREERLQDVPISVQAIQESTLEKLNITKTADLNALAAGLSVDTGGNSRNLNFAMRGQTQALSSPEPGVQVYFDQLPVLYGGIDFFDLGQIEVLHGPQGTLFGRNTTGGAVVIHPQAPTFKFEGYLEAGAGNLNARNVEGAVNIPIVADKLAVRISGIRTHRDGYVTDIANGRKLNGEGTDALRAQVLFRPIDQFEDKVLLGYRRQSTDGIGFTPTRPETLQTMFGFPGLEAFFPTANTLLAANYALAQASDWRQIRNGTLKSLSVRDYVVENIATLKLDDNLTLRDIFGYSRNTYAENWDLDETPLPLVQSDKAANGFQMYTNELQLLGKALANKLDWIVGTYYQDLASVQPFVNEFTALGTTYLTAATTSSISKALYAQGTYQITPKISVTGGIRETWDTRSGLQGNSYPLTNWTRVETSAPNWTFSLNYKLQPDTLIYVATREGYKAGGVNFQATPPAPTSYAPEKLKDVEVGLKTQWAMGDVRQRLNLDYYHSWYNGVQSQTSVVEPTGQVVTVLFNAGSAVINGIEAEYNTRFGAAADLTVNYAYTDFQFKRFYDPFAGTSLLGQEQPDTPKHKLTIAGDVYAPVAASVGTVYASAKYSYQSRVVFYAPAFAGAEQNGYGTFDLALNWDGVMGSSANVSVFARNVTDKLYFIGGSGGAVPTYSLQLRGEPRTYGLKVRFNF